MAKAVLGFNGGRTTFFRAGLFRGSQVQPHHASSLRRYNKFNRPSCNWADIESEVEVHLKKSIPIRHPINMFGPMHYLTFAAPKTRAPALCIASCELVGGDRDQAVTAAAAAIHLVHAAAYVHENLLLETTSSGRSRPPVTHKFHPHIELLTGDAILPFAFELLARSMKYSPKNKADQILRVIVEISKASGSQGIIYGGGELKKMGMMEYEKNRQGELHACGAACGAILGGGSEEEIEKLRKYGVYAGMIQGLLVHHGKNSSSNTTEMVEKLRVLAMEQLLPTFNISKTDHIIFEVLDN